MPRKRKRASDGDADKLSSLESIVFVLRASRHGGRRIHEISVTWLASKQFVDKKAFEKIKWQARDTLKRWNETPGSMPLGAARFILEQCEKDEESANIAVDLELNNLATTVISMHTNSCRGICTQDNHLQHQQSVAEEMNHHDDDDGTIISSNIASTGECLKVYTLNYIIFYLVF